MAEYIERGALVERLKTNYQQTNQAHDADRQWAIGFNTGLEKALYCLAYAQAEEVKVIAHGRWIRSRFYGSCSVCDATFSVSNGKPEEYFKYCPKCGAKMDL